MKKSKNKSTRNLQLHYSRLDYSSRSKLSKELMEKCFVCRSTVWKWMNGKRFPKKVTQIIIADTIGVTPDTLFSKHK